MNKIVSFAIGALVGAAAITVIRTPAFRKSCAKILSAGMRLKDDAQALVESIKEDAEDIVAEAKHVNAASKEAKS